MMTVVQKNTVLQRDAAEKGLDRACDSILDQYENLCSRFEDAAKKYCTDSYSRKVNRYLNRAERTGQSLKSSTALVRRFMPEILSDQHKSNAVQLLEALDARVDLINASVTEMKGRVDMRENFIHESEYDQMYED